VSRAKVLGGLARAVTGSAPEELAPVAERATRSIMPAPQRLASGGRARRPAPSAEERAALYAQLEQQYDLPEGYLARVRQIESSDGTRLFNRNSRAAGPFQFIPRTATAMGLRDPYDEVASAEAAARLAADNARQLRRRGFEIDAPTLYLAHQQGAGGAVSLLQGNRPAVDIVGRNAVLWNAGNENMTGPQFAGRILDSFRGAPAPAPAPASSTVAAAPAQAPAQAPELPAPQPVVAQPPTPIPFPPPPPPLAPPAMRQRRTEVDPGALQRVMASLEMQGSPDTAISPMERHLQMVQQAQRRYVTPMPEQEPLRLAQGGEVYQATQPLFMREYYGPPEEAERYALGNERNFFGQREGFSGTSPVRRLPIEGGGGDGGDGDIRPLPATFVPNAAGQTTISGPAGGTYVQNPDAGPFMPSTGSVSKDISNIANTALPALGGTPLISSITSGLGDLSGVTSEDQTARQETRRDLDAMTERDVKDRLGITVEDLPALENISATYKPEAENLPTVDAASVKTTQTPFGNFSDSASAIDSLYDSVLNRDPDAGAEAYWLDRVEKVGWDNALREFGQGAAMELGPKANLDFLNMPEGDGTRGEPGPTGAPGTGNFAQDLGSFLSEPAVQDAAMAFGLGALTGGIGPGIAAATRGAASEALADMLGVEKSVPTVSDFISSIFGGYGSDKGIGDVNEGTFGSDKDAPGVGGEKGDNSPDGAPGGTPGGEASTSGGDMGGGPSGDSGDGYREGGLVGSLFDRFADGGPVGGINRDFLRDFAYLSPQVAQGRSLASPGGLARAARAQPLAAPAPGRSPLALAARGRRGAFR